MDKPTASESSTIARIVVRSTVWVSIGTYLNIFIGFVSNLVLTRALSPEIYGFFSMASFWSGQLNLRSKIGLNYAAIQHAKTDGQLLGTFYVLDLAAALVSFALSVIAAVILTLLGYRREVTLAIVILMCAESFAALVGPLSIVLEKELQLSWVTLVSLLASTIAYVIAISLALAGGGIWSLLAINGITTLLSMGGVYWVCKRRLPQTFGLKWQFKPALAKQLLGRGIPTGLSLTASSIVTQFDNFLIGTFVGYATLGFYDRAYRIAHWPNLLLTMIVGRVGFLTYSKVQNDLPRLTHAVRLSVWVLSTLGIPITLLLVFGAPDIVYLLYGPTWSESAVYLRFLAIYSLVWPFVGVGFWLSVALGHPRTTTLLTVTQAITLAVVATPLTLRWGVMGTIAGVMTTMLVAFGMTCFYVFRQVPLSIIETLGVPALATLAGALATLLVSRLIDWNGLLPLARLVITGVVGPGTFVVFIIAMRPAEMKDRLRYLAQAWRRA